jgi:hypothetical protein
MIKQPRRLISSFAPAYSQKRYGSTFVKPLMLAANHGSIGLCLVEAAARDVSGYSEEGDGLAIRTHLLANLERKECPVLQGGSDHDDRAVADHQGTGRAMGSSGSQGFKKFSVGVVHCSPSLSM